MQPQHEFIGYVPKVGDRVQVVAAAGLFGGKLGTVTAVAPSLANCHVWIDDLGQDNRMLGYPGVRIFPGEIEALPPPLPDLSICPGCGVGVNGTCLCDLEF